MRISFVRQTELVSVIRDQIWFLVRRGSEGLVVFSRFFSEVLLFFLVVDVVPGLVGGRWRRIYRVSRDPGESGMGSQVFRRYALRCDVDDVGDGFNGAALIGTRLFNRPLRRGGMKLDLFERSLNLVHDESCDGRCSGCVQSDWRQRWWIDCRRLW